MEFISGFDATPYLGSEWGKAKYKIGVDEHDGMKRSMGNGVDVHPSKKKRMKQSAALGVEIKRLKGSDYLPLPELHALVIPADRHIPGQMGVPSEYAEGIGSHHQERFKELHASGDLLAYRHGFDARVRIAKEWNERVVREYKEAHRLRTDTAEYAYKIMRLDAADILEHAKREGITPAQFYKEFRAELKRIAKDAACAARIEESALVAYLAQVAPKLHASVFAVPDKPAPKHEEPSEPTIEVLQKQLERAVKRRDKAQAEIDALDVQITAMLMKDTTIEEVVEQFYPEPESRPESVEQLGDKPLSKRERRAMRRRERKARQRTKRERSLV